MVVIREGKQTNLTVTPIQRPEEPVIAEEMDEPGMMPPPFRMNEPMIGS